MAITGTGGKIYLLFGIPGFSISVFDGLIGLVPDELGKSRLKFSNKSVSEKTSISPHLVVRKLADLIMGLSIVLNQYFLFKVIPHPGYAQSRMGTTKPAVHTVSKFLPGVVSQGI